MSPQHRVLLVREWDQQMSGSGCCGRLGGEAVGTIGGTATDPYSGTRAAMECAGAAYRALRDSFTEDELDLTVVDPRNTVWLLPAVWRDARRRGLTAVSALRQLNAATTAGALVCDGLVLVANPGPEQAVAAVRADLAAREARHLGRDR